MECAVEWLTVELEVVAVGVVPFLLLEEEF